MKKTNEKNLTGVKDKTPRLYEIQHREIAKRAAAEGFVLLKNNGILPLKKGEKIALYGAGAAKTVKGGIGSGDVNERASVSILQGMKNAGFHIANEQWSIDFENAYEKARLEWRDRIHDRVERHGSARFFEIYTQDPFVCPTGEINIPPCSCEIAIFVLSRNAGEGMDRKDVKGDYYLSEDEEVLLRNICKQHHSVIVAINSGGIIDLGFADKYENICALLYIVQPGMEGGSAFADVVSGNVTPSGKLTDTWALNYKDYPNADTFSYKSGSVHKEYYEEGIFVGYRYFDSFDIKARYPFGYGLSYTEFEISATKIEIADNQIEITVNVKNTGMAFSGKEVVQVYTSCPQGEIIKEYRRLSAFGKTQNLAPGEEENLVLRFGWYDLASFSEEKSAWFLERGDYIIWVGSSIAGSRIAGVISLDEEKILSKTQAVCPLAETLEEHKFNQELLLNKRLRLEEEIKHLGIIKETVSAGRIKAFEIDYDKSEFFSPEVEALSNKLTLDECVKMVVGDPEKSHQEVIGDSGGSVPGSAASTSDVGIKYGIPSIVTADGTAGLRLQKEYEVVDGEVVRLDFMSSVEGGLFAPGKKNSGEIYYQYCTAFPVATLVAQSWDTALIHEIGAAIGREMSIFGITLWLAPGLNIHRNPLCGRNYEYYSEDPLVSGVVAAEITKGVQSIGGVGTTIKHLACNNQEDNRSGSDSVVSERTLRELYLKGFEIAVKTAQPMSVMTSYNLINGVHTANSYDLCTSVLRHEWGFGGFVMSDWETTKPLPEGFAECSVPYLCISAGNDLIMPGTFNDMDNIRRALSDGSLSQKNLLNSVKRIVRSALSTKKQQNG